MIAASPVINVAQVKRHLDVDSPQPVSDRKIAAALEQLGCQSKRTDEGVIHITPYGVDAGFSKDSAPKALKDALRKAESVMF